jgi:hypothetical protein
VAFIYKKTKNQCRFSNPIEFRKQNIVYLITSPNFAWSRWFHVCAKMTWWIRLREQLSKMIFRGNMMQMGAIMLEMVTDQVK